MIIHTMEQGSEEWRKVRAGKLTGSNAQAIGNNGKGLETLAYQTVSEKHSSGEFEFYTNENMERGNELEDAARSIYELENDVEVEQVGFIEYNEFVGCSPDGLIGDKGAVEIKAHSDAKHVRFIVEGKIDPAYIWQMQMLLLITGREWCDYVAYNPNYTKSLVVQRVTPDEKAHAKLLEGFETGEKLIKEIESKLQQ